MGKALTTSEVQTRLKQYNFELIGVYNSKNKTHLVKCFCGKVVERKIELLINGRTKSCGCKRSSWISEKHKLTQEQVEEKMNKLSNNIKMLGEYVDWNTPVKFQCFCKKEFYTVPYYIFANKQKSCGCLARKENKPNWKGYKDMPGIVVGNIKHSAKHRGLMFDVSNEYLWELYISQGKKCKLSGLDIDFIGRTYSASLDRIDSSKGYIEGNVQWVHKDLNRIKWEFTQERFIEICKLVVEYNK